MIDQKWQQSRLANTPLRTLLGCIVALAVLPGGPLMQASPALGCGAKAFVVNSTGDTSDALVGDEICADAAGACTLRAVIEEANADNCKDSVNFNIPGADAGCNAITHVCTITPASVLPSVSQPIVIMGDTQPGFQWNTLPNADNSVLLIELSGAALPAGSNGITISAGNSDVAGLVINRFAPLGTGSGSGGGAIVLTTNGSNRVYANFIGTDPTGTIAYGNGRGVVINSGNNMVGGQGLTLRNLISGNGSGINIAGTGASTNAVYNNLIGTQADGSTALGNTGVAGINIVSGASGNAIGGTFPNMPNVIAANMASNIRIAGTTTANNAIEGNYIGTNAAGAVLGGGPILIDGGAHNNRIGGTAPGAGNTIAYSIGKGIVATAAGGAANTISSNSIFGNASLGIDLIDEGVTANDVCDGDAGPNLQQNYPLLTAATSDGSSTTIVGTLNSVASVTFTLQFFDSPSCDPSGYGQGQTLIGSISVTPDITCTAAFNVTFPYGLALGHAVTATATDVAGNTSEFGPCVSGTVAPIATPSLPPVSTDTPTVTPTATPSFALPPITATPACTAKTFVVDSTADNSDATVGDGLCVDAVGNCTLRAAIEEANADSCADVINFNIPHSDGGCNPAALPPWVCTIFPASDLPAVIQPVTIDGYTQPGASANTLAVADNALLQIQISGNGAAARGLYIVAGNSTVRGLVINGVTDEAIRIESGGGNVVEGNFVCTDPTGTFAPNIGAAPLCGSGVHIAASADNRIGGITPAARNILSGATSGAGMTIDLVGATNNVVQGNLIGLRTEGSAGLGNATNGVGIFSSAGGNIIGGATAEARNIISGNGGANVQLGRGDYSDRATSGNSVYGNYIGTDATGMIAVRGGGVLIDGAWANQIGREVADVGVIGNLISGNDLNGITLSNGAQANFIVGNTIGNNAIGGGLGNPGSGVSLVDTDTSYNAIGGSGAGQGNTISRSGGAGISANAGLYNSIVSNSIFSNGTLGIDLGSDGVTADDPCDIDDGPDRLQNFPVLSSVSNGGATTSIAGSLDGSPSTSFTIQFFGSRNCDSSGYGEGHTLIGSTVVATDETCGATFNVTFPFALATERFVSATATDATGNTSEFSACRAACGDGIVSSGEQCDDGNYASGDGCSSACVVESGWTCTGQPSTCMPPNGQPCTVASQCASGFCVDGVCCGSACGGGSTTDCQACSVAMGAAADGVCTPLNSFAMGAATDGVLSPFPFTCDDGNPCTTEEICVLGTCSGTPLPANTPCTDDGSECTQDVCDAGGICQHLSPTAVYTLDADFEQGTLLSVNHDAPNNNQLQLSKPAAPFPFVNIAASVRGTIVRIDVNSGQVLGEYLTAPDSMGRNPSRTTVDQHGSVWVANRDEYGFSGGEYKGSVARVGLIVGGTRTDATGTPDLNGQYLKPPFQYSTCIDQDGDGMLKTSRGLGNILSWTNAGWADAEGGVSTAEDECLVNYVRVTGTGTRTVAIDANNDLWVGGLGDLDHEKLNGLTGLPIAGTQFNLGCGGYGGLIDPAGVLWSARGGSGLLRFDTTTLTGACLGVAMGDYGLGIDPQTGEIWQTDVYGAVVCKIAPNGITFSCYPHGEQYAQGVAVDGSGNVWVAHAIHAGSLTVGHLRTDGTFVGNLSLPGGSGPTGVAVDTNGKVWAANWGTDNAMRIDPSAGALGGGGFPIGAVDMTVSLGAGAGPYNYSDMTGFVAIGSTSPQGTWTVTRDGGVLGNVWGAVSWNTEPQASEPPDTTTLVEVRAANTLAALGGQSYIPVTNGGASGVSGRFLEVRVTLKASPSGLSPIFSDLRVQVGCGTTTCSADADCNDADGCTVDRCDPANVGANSSGCVYTGVVCRAPDACHATGTCNPVSGECVNPVKPDGASCPDQNLCNGDETCQSGVCTAGSPLVCEDENICTVDACDSASGCTHTPGNAGVVCRPTAGECDIAETCSGSSATCPEDNNPACTPTGGVSTPSPTATPTACGTNIFVVTSTAHTLDASVGDTLCADAGGVCTLHAAIQEANVDSCVDTIDFNIPSSDLGCDPTTHVCTILPASVLPSITQPVNIEGYTQPGASPNTLSDGNNAVLLVEISGAALPAGSNGLTITAGHSMVSGLVINRFQSGTGTPPSGGSAITIGTNGSNEVWGNFLGTDPTGTVAYGNGRGVSLNSGNNQVGGPGPNVDLRNLISGNGTGISISGTGASANRVFNNYIGTQRDGNTALGNTSLAGLNLGGGATGNMIGATTAGWGNVIAANLPSNIRVSGSSTRNNLIQGNYIGTNASGASLGGGGILIDGAANNNTIGGAAPGAGNVIAHNTTNGVTLTAAAGVGNGILGNSLFGNSSLGIDLGNDGVTANDACDVESGPNALQNYPVLTAVTTDGINTNIAGTLDSLPTTSFTIQFFESRNCDPSGYGEGHTLIGSTVVATGESCGASFNATFSFTLTAGRFVTATVTDTAGNTSELSACRAACGDGVISSGEQCDDGNNASGDGCSPACVVESGWDCTGQPSTCTPPNGEPCTTASQCASGFCVDGVCCGSACGGGSSTDCQACSVATGATADGTCSPLTGPVCDAGNDPCTIEPSCVAGACIGTPLAEGTPCTDDDNACTQDICDATGHCGHHSPAAIYTLDADFEQGTLLSVNHDAPNNDQLQLSQPAKPFPFVNIAASARGTIVRIDVNSGQILGEYLTAPDLMGRNPSRTTVDQHGSAWVANRDEYGFSGGQDKGSVARIGLIIGGIRCDATGSPDPNGQYFKPPFQYSTCVDRDGDGLFKTSHGLGNILPWTNAVSADTNGGVSTAEDECIINYTRVTGTGTRTVAIDANNDLWVGGLGDLDHEKLSGITGLPIPGTQFNLGCGGYGGLIDPSGVLWSARGGTGLLRFDTTTMTGACLGSGVGDYGLGIDPQTGEVWETSIFDGTVCKIAPSGIPIGCYPHGETYAQGVAVDGSGNVWVAHSLLNPSTTVGHLRTDGTFVGNVNMPTGSGPTGVAVDANGKVWVVNFNSNDAVRIDPSAGAIGGGGFPIGAVDMTVSLGADAWPYNYSDMTGFVAIGSTSPQGTWTVTRDAVTPGNAWGSITWNTEPQASEPAGTSIIVEARAANTLAALGSQSFTAMSNGGPSAVSGRFIEIRTTLKASPSGVSPVLSDLRVEVGCGATTCSTDADCGDADGCTVDRCDPTNAAANSFGCVYTGIVCGLPDTCHEAGACNPVSGECSGPAKPDGTECTDTDRCNTAKACQSGVCAGGSPVSCDDENICTVDACDTANGCTHTPGNAGVVCRASAGACDVAETCDGSSATCPVDNNPACTPTPGACGPKILVVTSTADTSDASIGDTFCADAGGVCTLRAAIEEANADSCADTINFNIPSDDPGCSPTTHVCTIAPATALPTVTKPVTIDGYTQPGATLNTLATSDNAVLLIEINGAGVPKGNHGLNIAAGSSVVRGLVINRFRRSDSGNVGGNAINLMTNGGNVITGNFLGTDPAGLRALPNQRGVAMTDGSSANVIGGSLPALRNLASGNTGAGISIGGGTGITTANLVQNNFIGTQADGTTALANGSGVNFIAAIGNHVGGTTSDLRNVIAANGINVRLFNGASGNVIEGNYIGTGADGVAQLGGGGVVLDTTAASNMIGGTTPGAGNLISHNATNGVTLTAAAGAGNSILSNTIYGNGSLGIDLGNDSVTANDPCDPDSGANALQNYPVLTTVAPAAGGITISGTLDSAANTTFMIQFFETHCDASGYGEGHTLIGSTTVVTDGTCAATFDATFPFALTYFVSATATDSAGNTSEFSGCAAIATPTPAPSDTPTMTPTETPTVTLTPTSTSTEAPTSSPTQTPTSSAVATSSPSATPTDTPTAIATATQTVPAPSATSTPTYTASATRSATPSATPTITATGTNSPTSTSSPTATITATVTPTPCTPEGGPCDDGDLCTLTDTCQEGVCVGANAVVCVGDACHAAGTCDPETGECVNKVTVESRACDSCEDGVDNDSVGGTDYEDCSCNLLCESFDYGVIGTRATSRRTVYMGGDTHVSSAAMTGGAGFTSRASVCAERELALIAATTIDGAAAARQNATFGTGMDMRLGFFAARVPPGVLTTTAVAPMVGPGGLALTDPANLFPAGYVDLSGTHEEYTDCGVGIASLQVDRDALLALTPTADLGAVTHAIGDPAIVVSGPGPHILHMLRLRVRGRALLEIDGDDDSVVIVQIDRSFSIAQRAGVQVGGGLKPSNLIWALDRSGRAYIGSDTEEEPDDADAVFAGTVLAPERKIVVGKRSRIAGALLGRKVQLNGGVVVSHHPFTGVGP